MNSVSSTPGHNPLPRKTQPPSTKSNELQYPRSAGLVTKQLPEAQKTEINTTPSKNLFSTIPYDPHHRKAQPPTNKSRGLRDSTSLLLNPPLQGRETGKHATPSKNSFSTMGEAPPPAKIVPPAKKRKGPQDSADSIPNLPRETFETHTLFSTDGQAPVPTQIKPPVKKGNGPRDSTDSIRKQALAVLETQVHATSSNHHSPTHFEGDFPSSGYSRSREKDSTRDQDFRERSLSREEIMETSRSKKNEPKEVDKTNRGVLQSNGSASSKVYPPNRTPKKTPSKQADNRNYKTTDGVKQDASEINGLNEAKADCKESKQTEDNLLAVVSPAGKRKVSGPKRSHKLNAGSTERSHQDSPKEFDRNVTVYLQYHQIEEKKGDVDLGPRQARVKAEKKISQSAGNIDEAEDGPENVSEQLDKEPAEASNVGSLEESINTNLRELPGQSEEEPTLEEVSNACSLAEGNDTNVVKETTTQEPPKLDNQHFQSEEKRYWVMVSGFVGFPTDDYVSKLEYISQLCCTKPTKRGARPATLTEFNKVYRFNLEQEERQEDFGEPDPAYHQHAVELKTWRYFFGDRHFPGCLS